MKLTANPLKIGRGTTGFGGYSDEEYTNVYGWGHFSTTSSASGYIHLKTNMISDSLVRASAVIEAYGYNYGTAQAIRCYWYGLSYNAPDYARLTLSGTGMTAHGQYKSSDGYWVLRGYVSNSYFMGFILNAHFAVENDAYIQQQSNEGFPGTPQLLGSAFNTTSGAYY